MRHELLDIPRLESTLRTTRIGKRLSWFNELDSTNDELWRRIDTPDVDGSVVLAEYQAAGRGRLGRTWHSPRGASVMCSVALVDGGSEFSGGSIALLCAVALCDAIRKSTGVTATVKWPNDVMLGDRKLGGVLVEAKHRADRQRAYVIGIGVNCLQQSGHFDSALADRATSLELVCDHPIDRTAVAAALLHELDHWLSESCGHGDGVLREAWIARCDQIGRRIGLRSGDRRIEGTVIDVDPSAALIVQLDTGGVCKFDAADTTICSC